MLFHNKQFSLTIIMGVLRMMGYKIFPYVGLNIDNVTWLYTHNIVS